jgi:hypothetical protein
MVGVGNKHIHGSLYIFHVQGVSKFFVHMVITVQKGAQNNLNICSYNDSVVRIMDNRRRLCECRVPLALAVGCHSVTLSQVVRQERRVLLNITCNFVCCNHQAHREI